MYAKDILGYVPEMTEINEKYVTVMKIQSWLDDGLTPEQIALKWNHPAGLAYGCSSGYNSKGVWYDSCAYVKSVMKQL